MFKRRSTLINLIDPTAMTLSLALRPVETGNAALGVVRSLLGGDTEQASQGLKGLVASAVNPQGNLKHMYRGGQILGAVVDGGIGIMEMAEGLSSGNRYLTALGTADLIGGTASGVIAAGFPTVSLGFTVLSAAAKTGLVVARPQQFTRIQKAKTVFDAGSAVCHSMLRAQIAVVPALIGSALLGPTQILYMNSDAFRTRVDALVDRVAVGLRP